MTSYFKLQSIAAWTAGVAVFVTVTGCGMRPSYSLLPAAASVSSPGGAATNNPGNGSGGDPTDPTAGSDDCATAGPNAVHMCHVPAGNPAAKHTICPDLQGAINGHGVNPSTPKQIGLHGGDYLGSC
jgi:hypothetical protein